MVVSEKVGGFDIIMCRFLRQKCSALLIERADIIKCDVIEVIECCILVMTDSEEIMFEV